MHEAIRLADDELACWITFFTEKEMLPGAWELSLSLKLLML